MIRALTTLKWSAKHLCERTSHHRLIPHQPLPERKKLYVAVILIISHALLRVPYPRQMSPLNLRRMLQPLVGGCVNTAAAGMTQIRRIPRSSPHLPGAIEHTSSPGVVEEVPTFSRCGRGRPQVFRTIRVRAFLEHHRTLCRFLILRLHALLSVISVKDNARMVF